ncbi:hypothetical protein LIER_13574 [Lithospermum erythrorhizon]|uniref:Secreted protein n=1 Tax=Lithospermum erythrorhizon TaxID=34254 RepID=A0AAV3PW07_LITER
MLVLQLYLALSALHGIVLERLSEEGSHSLVTTHEDLPLDEHCFGRLVSYELCITVKVISVARTCEKFIFVFC